MRILSSGSYLQINQAELDDRAQYTCVASNIAGKTTRHFNVAVHGKISATDAVALFQFIMPLKSLSINKIQTAAINCTCVLSGPKYQGRSSDSVGPHQ